MTTSPPPAASNSPAAPAGVLSGANKGLDRDAFLQLLVTQLSNQDPLNPQSGHEFAAQLAQFSSVEQLTTIGQTLASHTELLAGLSAGREASALSSAAGLIGQTVEARGNHAVWDGAEPAVTGFSISSPAASARVVVRDAAGQTVRTMDLGHLSPGRYTPTWDGRDGSGRLAAPGAYTFTVEAASAAGDPVAATPFTQGRVDRVTVEADGVRFWMGPHAIPADRVLALTT